MQQLTQSTGNPRLYSPRLYSASFIFPLLRNALHTSKTRIVENFTKTEKLNLFGYII